MTHIPHTGISRRRHVILAFFAMLLGWLFCTAALAVNSDRASMTTDGQKPVITIGIIADNEPYSWLENGHPIGLSIDILEELARITGLRFKYRAGSWPEIYPAFLRGEIDAIDEISYRDDRASLMLFTAPYHYRQTVIMHDSTRPLPPLQSLDQLKPYRVGIVRDIYYRSAFTSRGIAVTEYDGLPNLVRALAFGWIDAIAGPEMTLSFLAGKAGFNNLRVVGKVPMDGMEIEDFRIAVARNNEPLHRVLDAGLTAIPSKRMNELMESWQKYGGKTLSAKAQQFSLSEQDTAYVRRLGTLRVGIMRDYAPFSFLDNGHVQGLSVDVLARLQDLTGLQVTPVADRWPVLFDLFQRGELDIIANISDRPERRVFTRFTDAYYKIPNVVFTRDPTRQFSTLEDLRGLRIALGSGIYYESEMRTLFGEAIVSFSAQDAMFQALSEGSVDVVLAALPNGNHWVRKLGLLDIRIGGELTLDDSEGEDLRFGVRPALEPLVPILNAGLEAISPTERRTIEDRWMGARTRMEKAGNGQVLTLSDKENNYLNQKNRTISVCITADRMPLEGLNSLGQATGMSARFLELFETRTQTTVNIVPAPALSDVVEAMKARKCDLVPMAVSTLDQLRYTNFSSPYYTVPKIILGRVEAPFIDSLDELGEGPVAVVNEQAQSALLRSRHPRLRLIELEDETDGLTRLQQGQIKGLITTLATASYKLRELGLADIKVIGRLPGDLALSMATRNDEPEIETIVQKFIDGISDEDRQRIEDEWQTVRLEQKLDLKTLWQVLAAVAAVLLILFYWNRKLDALNKQLADANTKLAMLNATDTLTGIGNRQFFNQEFDTHFRWCQRHQLNFVVGMIDIDHFKAINDRYGHKAGDECLAALAKTLQDFSRRETDHVARIGGEEFVYFWSGGSEHEAIARFEQLRTDVEALRVNISNAEISLTISIGFSCGIPGSSDRAAELLERADRALYEAKRNGRNRTMMAPAQRLPQAPAIQMV